MGWFYFTTWSILVPVIYYETTCARWKSFSSFCKSARRLKSMRFTFSTQFLSSIWWWRSLNHSCTKTLQVGYNENSYFMSIDVIVGDLPDASTLVIAWLGKISRRTCAAILFTIQLWWCLWVGGSATRANVRRLLGNERVFPTGREASCTGTRLKTWRQWREKTRSET